MNDPLPESIRMIQRNRHLEEILNMKTISIVVPCYNEEKTIRELYEVIAGMFAPGGELSSYDYELILADDYSKDGTRGIIRQLCREDLHVRAVFNIANFGFSRNVFSALQESSGDAAFLVFGDLQDPPELLPQFVEKWSAGAKVVLGQKVKSDESHFMNFMRRAYYWMIRRLSDSPQIEESNGFGLYDQKFIEVLRQIEDVQPYLKTVIAEYAPDYEVITYHHRKSKRRSNFNLYRNYDFAMQGLTSSTKKLMRVSTGLGLVLAVIGIVYALSVLIRKLIFWDNFPAGTASLMVGVFMFGAAELFFTGILGEYVLSVNTQTMRKPRVVVEERINFPEKPKNSKKKKKKHKKKKNPELKELSAPAEGSSGEDVLTEAEERSSGMRTTGHPGSDEPLHILTGSGEDPES